MDSLYKENINQLTEGHVFYQFQDEGSYIDHLLSFIQSGLKYNQYVLIIENMRNLPKIKEKINEFVSSEQQSSIRLVNNFEYYLSNGDFHTQTIINHFQTDLLELKKLNSTVRTWAHVEWTSSEPDIELLKEFESTADDFVREENILSVCAYSTGQLNAKLICALEELHKYTMTDETFSVSKVYNRSF